MHRRIERKLNRGTCLGRCDEEKRDGPLCSSTSNTAYPPRHRRIRRYECREPGRRGAQHGQAANLVGAARSTMCTQAPG